MSNPTFTRLLCFSIKYRINQNFQPWCIRPLSTYHPIFQTHILNSLSPANFLQHSGHPDYLLFFQYVMEHHTSVPLLMLLFLSETYSFVYPPIQFKCDFHSFSYSVVTDLESVFLKMMGGFESSSKITF